MGQLIGPAVDFPVGQLLVFKDNCWRLWRPVYLLLDQLVDTHPVWILTLGVIPGQQLALLGLAEYGHVCDPLTWIGHDAL